MKPNSKLHKKQQALGVCPRCAGLIPSNDDYGSYMGAISRLTRGANRNHPSSKQIEICSACGQEEALQEFFNKEATPIKDWPVMTAEAILRRAEAFEILIEMDSIDSRERKDLDTTEE